MALQKEEALLEHEELSIALVDTAFESEEADLNIDISPETEISYQKIGSLPVDQTTKQADISIISDDTINLKHGEVKLVGDTLFIFNALLAFRDKAQRAEEIRALGFEHSDTLLSTRLRFRNRVNSLIKKVNTAADDTLILKTGTTKGTRYQIAPEAKIEDKRYSMLLIGENPSYLERYRVITELSKKYRDDPYVQQKLFSYRDTTHNRPMILGKDEVSAYLNEIGTYRLLTKKDEIELFGDIEKGLQRYASLGSLDNLSPEDMQAILDLVAAREIVFNTNLRLAVNLAKRYWRVRGTMSEMDVIQEANCGLANAIPRMKIEKGFKFSTYSTLWIKQAVRRALASQSREIRLPVHVHETYAKIMKDVRELSIELGREPSEAEIEQKLGMPIEEYYELKRRGRLHLTSLNQLVDEHSDMELGDIFARTEDDFTEGDRVVEATNTIAEILQKSTLTDKEKFIIGMRFGLGSAFLETLQVQDKWKQSVDIPKIISENAISGPLQLRDVGKLLGVSAERIRQIEIEAMGKLKRASKGIER